jgi:serine/threonine protein kinase
VGLGLTYLHENSVIHGDLKPVSRPSFVQAISDAGKKQSNVLIDENGIACLCDFGLSRKSTGQTVVPKVISNQEPPFAGTVKYMSPEQMELGITDKKSDIYSFGMTIYEARGDYLYADLSYMFRTRYFQVTPHLKMLVAGFGCVKR